MFLRTFKLCSLLVATLPPLAATAQSTATFDDLTLPGPESFYNGADNAGQFTSGGATFNNVYSGGFWSAWAYSNTTNVTTPGFLNEYSAITGGGVDGSENYAVAFNYAQGVSTINFAAPTTVSGGYFTNTTYAYLSVVDGNDGGSNFVKGPFTDGDFFRLDIIGKDAGGNETGLVEFYLADYRNGNSFAADSWVWVDLSPLGANVKSLEFNLASSDNGQFGMNTPSYFALDDLVFGAAAVPEPATCLGMIFCGLLAIASYRLVRRNCP